MKKYVSYSELRSWEYDRDEYYRQYILGEPFEPNAAMELGTIIHATIEDPKFNWLKELVDRGYEEDRIKVVRRLVNKAMRKRPPKSEVTITAKTQFGTSLLAKLDGLDKKGRVLWEYKTTEKPGRWNQHSVDTNEQISFYAHVFRLKYHAYFSDIMLVAIDTLKGNVKTYHTARGPRDIDYMAEKVERLCDEIHQAGYWNLRLSKAERLSANQIALPI